MSSLPQFNITNRVERFWSALQRRDFPTLMNFHHEFETETERLKANTPKFLLTKKLEEYTTETSNSFQWYYPLQLFASLKPKQEIVEVREWEITRYVNGDGILIPAYDVFVSLDFTSWTNAPFRFPMNAQFYRGKGKPIKHLVTKITLTRDRGLFLAASIVDESVEMFDEVPFTIIALNVDHDEFFDVFVVGGQKPLASKTLVDGVQLESAGQLIPGETGYRIQLTGLPRNPLLSIRAERKGTVEVTDASGKSDSVSFIIPAFVPEDAPANSEEEQRRKKPPYLLRHPWANALHWTNTYLLTGPQNVHSLESAGERK